VTRVLLLSALLVAGCGYRMGPVAPGEGRSLAVPIFLNATWRRDLERDLTRAVRQEFRSRTDYDIVEEGDADLVLEGRIVEISEGLLSEREGAEIRESSVRVVAVVTVTDRETGEKVVDSVRIAERRAFVPVKGETLRSAETAALRGLAERIVYTLSSAW
jgi:hypothetical protein